MADILLLSSFFEIPALPLGLNLSAIALYGLNNYALLSDSFSPTEKTKPWLDTAELPQVTIQIPCRNEPLDVVKNNSLKSALALNYPREKLTIQLVDNSEQGKYEELAAYCQEQGVKFIHREGRDGGKARNLNIGLGLLPVNGQYYEPQSDLYFLVDSDITFEPDTIQKLLPEFKADPRLPFVVCEAEPGGGNLFTDSIAAAEMPKFYGSTNIEKYGFTNSTGFGLLYNRHALNEIQGWPEDSVSEDWATSMAIRARAEYWTKGKRVNYVQLIDPVPANLERRKIQQARWAQGNMENLRWYLPALLKAKHIPWNEKIDALTRIFGYPSQAIAQVFMPLITMIGGSAYALLGSGSVSNITNYLLINNASAWLQSLGLSFRLLIIPFLLLAGLPALYIKIRKGNKSALRFLKNVFPGSLASIGTGLAVARGVKTGLFGKKNALFNVTPKGKIQKENTLSRILQKNWKEIVFGSTILLFSIFLLPGYAGFLGLLGLGFVVAPFMPLIKIPKNTPPDISETKDRSVSD
jgi:cellulose synthase/poly-beta-1,6-N-acetylglucosamine synthase-like glycosyltransferase